MGPESSLLTRSGRTYWVRANLPSELAADITPASPKKSGKRFLEPFRLGDVRATCLICADGNSERAWTQVSETDPQLVFWPNNRHRFRHGWLEVIDRARQVGRPMLAQIIWVST